MATQSTDFIPCVLLSLKQQYLLLPNASIAEVIPLPRSISRTSDHGFELGQYDWQDQTINVVDLDSLIEGQASACEDASKLCVLHSIDQQSPTKNYAFPCYGAPQLIHLTESALNLVEVEKDSEFIHCQTQVGTKLAYIPNLDAIESAILNQ